jgi:hypothetical protein
LALDVGQSLKGEAWRQRTLRNVDHHRRFTFCLARLRVTKLRERARVAAHLAHPLSYRWP